MRLTRNVQSFSSISVRRVPDWRPTWRKQWRARSSTPSKSGPWSSPSAPFSVTYRSLFKACTSALLGSPPSSRIFYIYFFFYNSFYLAGPYSLSSENRSKALNPLVSNMTFRIISHDFSPWAMISKMFAVNCVSAVPSCLDLLSFVAFAFDPKRSSLLLRNSVAISSSALLLPLRCDFVILAAL